MRVALDATPLTLTSGGLARYTAELAAALAEQFPQDEYLLISDQPASGLRLSPIDRRWWLFGAARHMRRAGAELFHGTNFSVPYLPLYPSVLTLHDLSPWMDPRWHSDARRVRARTPLLLGLGLATMVITDSEAVRRQAMDRFHLRPDRIAAVPLAARSRFRPVAPRAGRYFLFVGTLEPRKNLSALAGAWRPVYAEYGVELWIAGRRRAGFDELPLEPGLRLLGEVADEDLPALYSGAIAFVYPSLYEGFGLPVLEAMQCGACVVTSTDASIAEVCGDAALRLDARDERAWSEALRACAAGGSWVERLRHKALARAAEFSWARTAIRTREVYAEACRRHIIP